MASTQRVVVVCGYGCNLDSPLKPYLDRVAAFCRDYQPQVIILCGGATQQQTFPGKTEALVMYQYLHDKLFGDPESYWYTSVLLENESYTTYENIRGAARMEPGGKEITIFCEATRALKVALLARHFFGFPPANGLPPIRIETDSWELMHPTLELLGTIKEWIAIRFPLLNTLQSRARRRRALSR